MEHALAPTECYFDVKALFAGLVVDGEHDLAPGVWAEKIFENNLVAQVAQTAMDVLLGLRTDPEVPYRPVCGLVYRVRGERLRAAPEDQLQAVSARNAATIAAPKIAFRRAIALLYGVELLEGGTFVWETDYLANRRLSSYQFNKWSLSVHYEAAHVYDGNAATIRSLFAHLVHSYFARDGRSIAIAIDRLGAAGTRADPIDTNLDLCIASEIAFLYGVKRVKNELIAKTVREHARVFFGDGEFFWSRDEVDEILRIAYKERSDTVHGRKANDIDRASRILALNARHREVLKAALRIYAERRPLRLAARAEWPRRAGTQGPLGPIFQVGG